MKYCISCGQQLPDNAKFCSSCGNKITDVSETNSENERKTVYEGNIHKCPRCGEVLKSFSSNCPSCGHEIRDAKSSNAVKELALKLEEIERTRPREKRRLFGKTGLGKHITETDEKKISLIQSFPIPNTKEDLYEFFTLSKSNIDIDAYDTSHGDNTGSVRVALSNAWRAKFDQAYEKSKIIFSDEKDKLLEIQNIYDSTVKAIKKEKFKVWKLIIILYSVIILFCVLIFGGISLSDSRKEKAQINRLIQIENDIKDNIEEHDYQLALMNAKNLTCDKYSVDDNIRLEWKNKQEYYIEKIISEAKKDGVELSNPILDSLPKLEWENNKFTNLIPVPGSKYGKVEYQFDYSYAVTLYNISESDYEKYKQKCIKSGFDVKSNTESWFKAKDKSDNEITISYEDIDEEMKISVKLSEEK